MIILDSTDGGKLSDVNVINYDNKEYYNYAINDHYCVTLITDD